MTVEHGWNRPARGRMALGGEPTREHEDYAIVSINPMPVNPDHLRNTLNIVCNFLEENQRVRIETDHLSPLGLGLIKLRTMAQRDRLVRNSPYNLGPNHVITVVKHDEGINARSCTYIRVCWLLFLAFPLDFQKDVYIKAAVAPCGRLLEWYRDDNKSKILVQALLLNPNRVPRSLIVSRGTLIGGMGRSWAAPVFILNGHFPDAFPADEDPVPFDGEPHPEHGPVVMGPHPQDPDWQEEQQGAAPDLGVFGGNPHPNPVDDIANLYANAANNVIVQQAINGMDLDADENDEMDMDDDENEEADDQWPAWNHAGPGNNNGNGVVNENQVPEHPNVPQHFVDLDMSGSSMRFLRAQGPDIAIEEVFQVEEDSSSDATSIPADSSAAAEARAEAQARLSHCANIDIYHRRGIPSSNSAPASVLIQSLTHGNAVVYPQPMINFQLPVHFHLPPVDSSLQIVPWRIIPHVRALRWFPWFDQTVRIARARARAAKASTPESILIIDQEGILHDEVMHQSEVIATPSELSVVGGSSTPAFEIQSGDLRPSPGKGKGPATSPMGGKRKTMCLPAVVSSIDERTPLAQRSVRRSIRLRGDADGFRQDWGIKCGVDPEDLTEDVLLQEPSNVEIMEVEDE